MDAKTHSIHSLALDVLKDLDQQISSSNRRRFRRADIQTLIRNSLGLLPTPDVLSLLIIEFSQLVELMIEYLKKKGLLKQNFFRPLFVSHGDAVTPLFPPIHQTSFSGLYYVCQTCSRGFKSTRGLADHEKSSSHVAAIKAEIDAIKAEGGIFKCPAFCCEFTSQTKDDVIRHIKTDKSKRIDCTTQVVSSITTPTIWRCDVCQLNLPTDLRVQHLGGRKHNAQTSNTSARMLLMEDKEDVSVTVSGDADVKELGKVHNLTLTITNTCVSDTSIMVVCSVKLEYDVPSVILSDLQNITKGGVQGSLPALVSYDINLNIKPTYTGLMVVPVLFSFKRGDVSFDILKRVCVNCVHNADLHETLKPKEPYVRPKRERRPQLEAVLSDFRPDFTQKYSLEMPLRLSQYSIPPDIRDAVRQRDLDSNILRGLGISADELDFSIYAQHFNKLIHLEEVQVQEDIAFYTLKGVSMHKNSMNNLIKLRVPGLAENRPSVLRGDHLFAIPQPGGCMKYEGHVHEVTLNDVSLGFAKRMRDNFINGEKYDIEFTINRLPIKLNHRAVTWAGERLYKLEDVLFPTPSRCRPLLSEDPHLLNISCYERRVESNREQLSAVKHIVCGTSRPAPYLIYGPPGTGKTFTLVESIKQVYKKFPESRILACAPQNAAADLITKQLRQLEHVDKRHILRVHALSRNYNDIEHESVKAVSNYEVAGGAYQTATAFRGGNKEVYYPSKEDLKKYRIIVVTLVTSGRFVSAEMKGHFTHVFIDEAGHATEPETVIPLANLLDIDMANGGQLVLAGDPKQLGPVIRSSKASLGGLGVSLLERLMSQDVYKKDPHTGFNPVYVTKLIRSFRSHPDILKIPNECFYDAELQVFADRVDRERFCRWEGLPSKDFPLVFHGVNGMEGREERSPSWFNLNEIDVVQKVVRDLSECKSPRVTNADIGIISPYHQQVKKLKEAMQVLDRQHAGVPRHFNKIKVGSVEKFQGDEKEIIIISTVRSQLADQLPNDHKFNLGFVGNPKRFNVAVTRAKALVYVIGNPALLCQDPNWRKLILHIKNGGGYTGCPFPDGFECEDPVNDLNMEGLNIRSDESFRSDSDNEGEANISAYIQQVNPEMVRTDG